MKIINRLSPSIFKVGDPRVELKKLPLGTYKVNVSDDLGFFLEKIDSANLPDKLYIDTKLPDYWVKSYNARSSNVGILMTGIKGTGKTVTAKYVCKKVQLPVIVLNPSLKIADQLAYINQEAIGDFVFFLDEFEKFIDQEDNSKTIASILNFLDGSSVNKVLTIICVNGRVNEFLLGRLGRVLFKTEFVGLSIKQVTAICKDFLLEKEEADRIASYLVSNMEDITIDNIVNIIIEYNIGEKSIEELLKILNIAEQKFLTDCYEIVDGEELKVEGPYSIDSISELADCYISRNRMLNSLRDKYLNDELFRKKYEPIALKQLADWGYDKKDLESSLYQANMFIQDSFSGNNRIYLGESSIEVIEKTKTHITLKVENRPGISNKSPFSDGHIFKIYLTPLNMSSKKKTF